MLYAFFLFDLDNCVIYDFFLAYSVQNLKHEKRNLPFHILCQKVLVEWNTKFMR